MRGAGVLFCCLNLCVCGNISLTSVASFIFMASAVTSRGSVAPSHGSFGESAQSPGWGQCGQHSRFLALGNEAVASLSVCSLAFNS